MIKRILLKTIPVLILCLAAAMPAFAETTVPEMGAENSIADSGQTDADARDETLNSASASAGDAAEESAQEAKNGAESDETADEISQTEEGEPAPEKGCEATGERETEISSEEADAVADAESDTVSEAEDESAAMNNNSLKLIAIGHGELSADKEGRVICKSHEGYEIISITADRDAEGIRKGAEIPEDEISDISFQEGTTITAVFGKIPEDSMLSIRPVSAHAAFGSEDAPQQ